MSAESSLTSYLPKMVIVSDDHHIDEITIGPMTRVFGDDAASLEVAMILLPTDVLEALNSVELNKKPQIVVFGRKCRQQRDVRFFSKRKDDGTFEADGYRYSGQLAQPHDMPGEMQELFSLVNDTYGENFNGVLMNRYNNGSEYISAHADANENLGNNGVFAIVWGDPERIFRVRQKTPGKKTNPIVYEFKPSMFIDAEEQQLSPESDYSYIMWMRGNFQELFTHEVPRQKGKGMRSSLTLRRHLM